MKLFLAVVMVMTPLVAAEPAAAKTQGPAKTATAAKANEIPKGAVEVQPGTFRHTDEAGKKWIYRKTPFGIARMADNGQVNAAPAQPAATERKEAAAAPQGKVTAVEEGDTVHFERPGPFGVYRWDRKKSELNEAEKAWLAASRAETRQTARQD